MPEPIRRRGAAAAVLALATAAVVAGCSGGAREQSGDVARTEPPPDAVRMVMEDNVFVPDALTAAPGEEVVLDVVNEGRAPHNLVIEALDLSTGTMASGDRLVATFPMPDEAVTFVCTFHRGMDGRIEPTG